MLLTAESFSVTRQRKMYPSKHKKGATTTEIAEAQVSPGRVPLNPVPRNLSLCRVNLPQDQ